MPNPSTHSGHLDIEPTCSFMSMATSLPGRAITTEAGETTRGGGGERRSAWSNSDMLFMRTMKGWVMLDDRAFLSCGMGRWETQHMGRVSISRCSLGAV